MLPHPPYSFFMVLSLGVFLAARSVLPRPPALRQLPWRQRTALALAGFVGGAFGAKLPFVTLANESWLSGSVWFRDGKTITTGLVGAYLGVELAKIVLGLRIKTGDSYALPLALALAVGRWGCFFNGCCYGLPTLAPWGVDFGDGIRRHPTQLYEGLFHFSMALVLCRVQCRGLLVNQRLKLYLIAYCGFRFLTEWLRPEPVQAAGLTFYQWVALAFAGALAWQWLRHRPGVEICSIPARDTTIQRLVG